MLDEASREILLDQGRSNMLGLAFPLSLSLSPSLSPSL